MVKVTLTLDDETLERWRRLAAILRRPLSHIVRDAIKHYEAHSDRLSEAERRRVRAMLAEIMKAPRARSRAVQP